MALAVSLRHQEEIFGEPPDHVFFSLYSHLGALAKRGVGRVEKVQRESE